MQLLLLGGSGFLSGTVARRAVEQGYTVWAVTRGQKPLPPGVTPVVGDRRNRPAFAQAIAGLRTQWDLVIDCIGYEPEDARQDIAVFRERARQFAFVSTDFVFDPRQRRFPQPEDGAYVRDGYGGNKRTCELEFERGDCGDMAWTIIRPCHIYGPGSELGCLPRHARDPKLIQRLKDGEPLELVGGGHFLQQPIFARDLADLLLSVCGNRQCRNRIFNAAGPDIVESRTYYQIIADALGVKLQVKEIPVHNYLAAHPDSASFLCHRIYDLGKLKASGLKVPATPLAEGLREHVASLRPHTKPSPRPYTSL